jgi:glycosyltransferase involved in cell wall biosynthesis
MMSNEKKTTPKIIMLLASTYVTDPRVRNEAESLSEFGHDITVLSWDRSGRQPGYQKLSSRISVASFKLLHGTNFSKLRYAVSAFMFQFACVAWFLKNIRKQNVEITIHSHDFNTLPAAVALKILHRGATLVYDSHEFTPGAFSEWYGRAVGTLAAATEKILLPHFVDKMITVSPPIASYLQQITDKRVYLVYNTIKLSDVPKQDRNWWRKRYKLKDSDFVVSYVGGLREDVAVESLIEAAKKCSSSYGGGQMKFVIVGDGTRLDSLRKQAQGTEEYLTFVPRVSHDLALGYVKASDVTFGVYKDMGENTRIAMPWKVFESMACGTPILVRAKTYTWQFVKNLKLGLSAGRGTPDEIASQLTWARNNRDHLRSISKEGEKNFLSKFNWDNMARTLFEVYGTKQEEIIRARKNSELLEQSIVPETH